MTQTRPKHRRFFVATTPPLANNSAGLLASLCPPFFSPPEHPVGCGRVEREDVGWQLGLAATGGNSPVRRACRAGFPPAQPGWNLPKHQALQPPQASPVCAWGSAPGGSFCRAFGGVRAGDEKQKKKISPAPCICWAEPPFSCGGGCGASLGAGKACPGASLPLSRNARSLY